MARIAGVNIPQNKVVHVALTYIHGVGKKYSNDICNKLIICGTPNEVAEQILEFKEEVGEFGTLLYAGHDWKDVPLARNSMKLMAEKVMPQINKHSNIAAE